MRVFQSVFLNDTLDHDTRDQKKKKKSWENIREPQ